MTNYFMRYFNNIPLFLFIAFGICSCTSSKKLIEQSRTEFGRIKIYAVNSPDNKYSIIKLYAEIDSNGIKRYYSFYSKGIIMTDERAKNLSYNVLFKQLPNNFDGNIYQRFSKFDTLVFDKVEMLLKRSEYSHLKSVKGSNGYEIEVYYLHGFPKDRKFQPL